MGSLKKAPKMSKIRDNPFYFLFLNLISSGVKQLPVSYGLILINFASFLVNTMHYILIIGSYLYTTYSNWSVRRLRRRVDEFINTKGTSTISDVDLDSAIRITQSQILSSLRQSGHLNINTEQLMPSDNSVDNSSLQSTMSKSAMQNQVTHIQSPQRQNHPQSLPKPDLNRNQVFSHPTAESEATGTRQEVATQYANNKTLIQDMDRSVQTEVNRTPSRYVTDPRPHSSRSLIESSIASLSNRSVNCGTYQDEVVLKLPVSQSGDQIYEPNTPGDLISLKEISSCSDSSSKSNPDPVLRNRRRSNDSLHELPRGSVIPNTEPAESRLRESPRSTIQSNRSTTIRDRTVQSKLTDKFISSTRKEFSRTNSACSTSNSTSDIHNETFLLDHDRSTPPIEHSTIKTTDDIDSQRLTVIRGNEEQTRMSLATEMPRMTHMEKQYREIQEVENESSDHSFDPFEETNHTCATSLSNDLNRRLEAGDGSQLEIIGGVQYLKGRLQMEKEALIKIRNEQALAKTRNDQMVDEAVCKIDSVKTNIRGNLNQIRNLFKS